MSSSVDGVRPMRNEFRQLGCWPTVTINNGRPMYRYPFVGCPTVDEIGAFRAEPSALPDTRRRAVDAHLDQCESCRVAADAYSPDVDLPIPPPPDDADWLGPERQSSCDPQPGEIWATDVPYRAPGIPSSVPDDHRLSLWVLVLDALEEYSSGCVAYSVAPVTEEVEFASDWSWILNESAVDRYGAWIVHLDFQEPASSSRLTQRLGSLSGIAKTELFVSLAAFDRGDAPPAALATGDFGSLAFRVSSAWIAFEQSLVEALTELSCDLVDAVAPRSPLPTRDLPDSNYRLLPTGGVESLFVDAFHPYVRSVAGGDFDQFASLLNVQVTLSDLRPVLNSSLRTFPRALLSNGFTVGSDGYGDAMRIWREAQRFMNKPTGGVIGERAARHSDPSDRL